MPSKDIIEIYKETKDFKKAVMLSGLPPLQAHIKLLSSGVLELKDKIRYSSRTGQLGAQAEELFEKMMPEAVNANRVIKKNNENFDFLYGKLKIDVKYSSISRDRRTKRYEIHHISRTDLIVAFLERETGAELNNPLIAIIPASFILGKNLTLTVNSEFLQMFLVEKAEVPAIIKQYEAIL